MTEDFGLGGDSDPLGMSTHMAYEWDPSHRWGISPWNVALQCVWTWVSLEASNSHLFPPWLALSREGSSAYPFFRLGLSPIKPQCTFFPEVASIWLICRTNVAVVTGLGRCFPGGGEGRRNLLAPSCSCWVEEWGPRKARLSTGEWMKLKAGWIQINQNADVLSARLRNWLYL